MTLVLPMPEEIGVVTVAVATFDDLRTALRFTPQCGADAIFTASLCAAEQQSKD